MIDVYLIKYKAKIQCKNQLFFQKSILKRFNVLLFDFNLTPQLTK
jgi:hypothetical protein